MYYWALLIYAIVNWASNTGRVSNFQTRLMRAGGGYQVNSLNSTAHRHETMQTCVLQKLAIFLFIIYVREYIALDFVRHIEMHMAISNVMTA